MDILPINQLGAPDDNEEDQTKNLEDGDNYISKDVAAFQDGFGLSSPKLKAKRRKKDIFEVHGGRIIRSTGRKDRHSKVVTARGARDRRVRLSPKTAILFYDVQDRLGFDRPSKAIDWLMTEAKAAIDALDEPPPPATNVAENVKHLNDDHNSISSFGFLTEAAALPSYDDFNSSISRGEEQFLSAPSATLPEMFDANLEIARLQRIFSWPNYASVSSPPLHFPAAADLGHSHMFSEREPLQSSYSRISNYSPQFPGVGFSNEEMLNFTAAATFKEDEKDNIIPVSSKSSSTASFFPTL